MHELLSEQSSHGLQHRILFLHPQLSVLAYTLGGIAATPSQLGFEQFQCHQLLTVQLQSLQVWCLNWSVECCTVKLKHHQGLATSHSWMNSWIIASAESLNLASAIPKPNCWCLLGQSLPDAQLRFDEGGRIHLMVHVSHNYKTHKLLCGLFWIFGASNCPLSCRIYVCPPFIHAHKLSG